MMLKCLNNQLVKRVEHYIGQAIRMDDDLELKVSRRKKAGWTAFSKVDVLFRINKITAQTKSHLFHSNVLRTLLYVIKLKLINEKDEVCKQQKDNGKANAGDKQDATHEERRIKKTVQISRDYH